MPVRPYRVTMLSGALSLCAALASAQYGAAGLTKSVILPAFNPAAPTCTSPPGLTKTLTFMQENGREFVQGVDHGRAMLEFG